MKTHARRCRAFTLFELIIVILIIWVLAAIAVPNHRCIRENPEFSRCRSELRTLQGALQMYEIDGRATADGAPRSASMTNAELLQAAGGGPWYQLDQALYDDMARGGYLYAEPQGVRYRCTYRRSTSDRFLLSCAKHGTVDEMEGRQKPCEARPWVSTPAGFATLLVGAALSLAIMACLIGATIVSVFNAAKRLAGGLLDSTTGADIEPVVAISPVLPRQTRRQPRPAQLPIVDRAGGAPGRCPVCAGGMEDTHVRCSACDTPHHAECFNYNGSCGIYACGSKRVTEDDRVIFVTHSLTATR